MAFDFARSVTYPGVVTVFQATVAIVFTVLASQLGILFFMINRMDALSRDLRSEIRDLGLKMDTHVFAHVKGDVD